MTQKANSRAPFAAPSSARHGRTLAVFALALFYVAHNVGGVFYQTRGIAPEHMRYGFFGYFAGIFLGALLLGFLERRRTRHEAGASGNRLRAFFLCALLFPSVFCQVSFQIAGYAGTPFLNFFQPALWSMHLPVALAFFFRYVRPGRQALLFGAAVSAGHICWALLMPLAVSSGTEAAALSQSLAGTGLDNRYLPLLNVTRNLIGAAFALLCLQMAKLETAPAYWRTFSGPARNAPESSGPPSSVGSRLIPLPGTFPTRQFALLLLPFLACAFYNGFAGSLFFPRMIGRGMYPEYMHLVLALLFPLLGLLIDRRGDAALRRIIGAAVLCFAVFPLPLFFSGSGAVAQSAAYLVCAAMQQVLLFCGAPAFARFAPFSRVPALVFCAAWLAASAAIPGGLFTSVVLPALSLPALPAACLLGALCAASLLPLRRAFPLPDIPAVPEEHAAAVPPETATAEAPAETPPEEDAGAETLRRKAFHLEAGAKLTAFAAAFELTAREAEALSVLTEGATLEEAASTLGISVNTVKFHIRGLLKKTALRNRQSLMHYYAVWKP